MRNMSAELVALDDIEKITAALCLREPKIIAKCVLGIKLLEVEVKNQLLELMENGDDFFKEPFTPAPPEEKREANDDAENVENEIPQSEVQDVLTAPKIPITGKLQVGKRTFDCTECSSTFNSRAAQRKHTDDVHSFKQGSFSIEISENGFNLKEEPPATRQKAEPSPSNEKGGRKARLSKVTGKPRKARIAQPRKTNCPTCNMEVVRVHMARHMRTHTGEKDFRCDECGSTFSRKDKLNDHIKRHANPELKPPKIHKCKRCDFFTIDREFLKQHLLTHPPETFPCAECDRSFTCQSSLEQHMIKHKPDKSFMCDFCGVSFSREPNLNRHVKVHTSPAPYKCRFCEKPYYRRNELLIHERSHTGEKPFICERCGASYSSSKYLNRHMQDKHSGLKPWKCDICEKAFSRAENMRAHRKIHDKRPNFGMKRSQKERRQQDVHPENSVIETSMQLCEINYTTAGEGRPMPFNDSL